MKINLFYLLLFFLTLNIRSYYLMYKDKRRAIKQRYRIPESSLLLSALLLGFVGVGLGMLTLRHKIRKISFTLGVPVITIINIALLVLLYDKLEQDYNYTFFYDDKLLGEVTDFLVKLFR